MLDGTPCTWMRGGTSKGAYLATDVPAELEGRAAFLLSVMGSPDPRQIDGIGGADTLTSKVATVSRRSMCPEWTAEIWRAGEDSNP